MNSTFFKFYFSFHRSSYSLSVVFYVMIKMKQNQNIYCYSFTISLVWNKKPYKADFFWHFLTPSSHMRDLKIIDMFKSSFERGLVTLKRLRFYHLWINYAVTFLPVLLLELVILYLSWSRNTMKTKTSLLRWFAIIFLKTTVNLLVRSTKQTP